MSRLLTLLRLGKLARNDELLEMSCKVSATMWAGIRLSLWDWFSEVMCLEVCVPPRSWLLADEPGMPDFVFSTAASPFTNRFRDQILSFDRKLTSCLGEYPNHAQSTK